MHGVGGNGPFVNPDPDPNLVPGRTGGGCIQSGPFKDLIVNLGPLNSLAYNPRCLTRDSAPTLQRGIVEQTTPSFACRTKTTGPSFAVLWQRGTMKHMGYMVVDIVQSGV